MIPLRILHAVQDPGSWDGLALGILADDLAHDLHESARLVPAGSPAGPGPEPIAVDRRWWRWWTGERARTLRAVAAWSPDLIHLHGTAALPLAQDVARLLGLRIVVSVLGEEPLDQLRRLQDPRVAWVLAPSEHHRARCIGEAGIPRDRVAPLPCGVPIPAVPPASDSAAWALGALVDDERGGGRALARLAAAVARARGEGSQVRLRLRAPAGLRDAAEALVEDGAGAVEIDASPTFEAFLGGIDVLASPSPAGLHVLPILLALAHARPVLAPPVGAAAELVPDGSAGLLLAEDGEPAMAAALASLDLPSRRAALGRGARRLAEERFAIAAVAQAAVELYRSAIGGSGTASRSEITTVYRRITERLR